MLVSLSSGEAETNGSAKACFRACGVANLACDLGFGVVLVEECAVSSGAVGVAQRRGSGKIRHLHGVCLLMQRAIKTGRIDTLTKIH